MPSESTSTSDPQAEAEHVLAWHFVGATLRDGRAVPADGVALRHDGPLVMCESGLHASERPLDALLYAPGKTLCRVRCAGQIIRDTDKLVCSERTILWRINASAILREFARLCALDVAHLWSAPEVVLDYLRTGDETKRSAARAAARVASEVDAWATTRTAAAKAAARAAGWASPEAAAKTAADSAAGAAAWISPEATWDAARAAQNRRLEQMLAHAATSRGAD